MLVEPSGWDELTAELNCWARAGRSATLWWRDDDAGAASAPLRRLLTLAATHRVPLALAAIPALAEAELAALLEPTPVRVLVHGFGHVNHARPGDKKSELGRERSTQAVVAELARGRERLARLLDGRVMPVLVPPWNRIAAGHLAQLPAAGFHGISRFGPRRGARPASGLIEVNCHVDIIDWRGRRSFAGTEPVLGALCGHLRARRGGAADATEPTGLLTHHRQHDAAAWAFLADLLDATAAHTGCAWLAPDTVFAALEVVQ